MTTSGIRKLTDRFTETEIDDEIVVMSLENGDFFSLAGTSRAIWQMIDASLDRGSLLSALASDYGVGEEDIAADVDDFLAQLRNSGLIDGN